MIEYQNGDLFETAVEALVNPVNTKGYMGKGLARQFKKRFKANYRAYADACMRGDVRLGEMFVWEEQTLEGRRIIINFPTKGHWRARSRLADIVEGLDDLRRVIRERSIGSIAVPALGAGLGGLDWADVKDAIESALGDLDSTTVLVFEPRGSSHETNPEDTAV